MLDPEGKNNLHMMTFYVETRWYRAPELLVSFKNYTPAGRIKIINLTLS
jgi:hypothetical protein